MQRTVAFEYKGKKYVSKPFDLGCVALMSDASIERGGEKSSVVSLCVEADIINHMFEGTEATADVLNELDLYELVRMCGEIYDIYVNSFQKPERVET